MASIAARAERLALAVDAVERAMGELATAQGIEAPSLPTSRDPMIGQAMQLEEVAAFLRTLAEASTTAPSSKTRSKG